MGLNISVERLVNLVDEIDPISGHVCYWDTEEVTTWDHLRKAGDTDFYNDVDFDHIGVEGDRLYYRPTNLEAARNYIRQHVYMTDGRKQEFLRVLDEMENDPKLVFHFSL